MTEKVPTLYAAGFYPIVSMKTEKLKVKGWKRLPC
jgi:hypothetical protein